VSTTASTDWKELDSREADGLTVSLLWSSADDRVRVAVVDQTHGDEFHVDLQGAYALDAFNHPYAYATADAFASTMRASSLDLQPQS